MTNATKAAPSFDDKVRVLTRPGTYPDAPPDVTLVETHMSCVFLAGDRAYKLKKPVRFPFLDFSTLEARERNCKEELHLNRRLTNGVYLDVIPLTLDAHGALTLRGDGRVIDWLVEMRRLPAELMLDRLIETGQFNEINLDALAQRLCEFYRHAKASDITPADYAARFLREQRKNRDILTSRNFALDHGRAHAILDGLDARLEADRELLEARVEARRVVDGHGDLRPEHVCFTSPVAVFDCLEFNKELRQVDPLDELCFLGMECARLGAALIGPRLIETVSRALADHAPPRLIGLYTAWRAMLRARLAIAHLLDPVPRLPEKWEPLAGRYLEIAEKALA